MLKVKITTSEPRFVASSLNLRVDISHTGVSRDGTEEIIHTFPRKDENSTGCKSFPTAMKFGAGSPILGSSPKRVIGFPRMVTRFGRSFMKYFPFCFIPLTLAG